MRAELRTRLVVSLLAVTGLAAACGGDDATEEPEGLPVDPAAVSKVIAEAADQSDATEHDATEQTDQTEADAEPEPEPELQPEPSPEPVRLGDRFEWCGEVQADFDEMVQEQEAVDAAEAALQDAQATLDAATDELDQVEARQIRDAAAERLDRLENESGGSTSRAALWLRDLGYGGSDESRPVAFERALTAYYEAANPDVAAMLWDNVGFGYPPLAPLPGTALSFDVSLWALVDADRTPEETLAAIAAYRAAAVPVAEDAVKAATDGWRAFQQADTTGEMLAAHTTLAEAYNQARRAYGVAEDARNDASYISRQDRRKYQDVFDAAEDAFQAVFEASTTYEIDFSAIKGRINALALADTAGMNAFWASLADSCTP